MFKFKKIFIFVICTLQLSSLHAGKNFPRMPRILIADTPADVSQFQAHKYLATKIKRFRKKKIIHETHAEMKEDYEEFSSNSWKGKNLSHVHTLERTHGDTVLKSFIGSYFWKEKLSSKQCVKKDDHPPFSLLVYGIMDAIDSDDESSSDSESEEDSEELFFTELLSEKEDTTPVNELLVSIMEKINSKLREKISLDKCRIYFQQQESDLLEILDSYRPHLVNMSFSSIFIRTKSQNKLEKELKERFHYSKSSIRLVKKTVEHFADLFAFMRTVYFWNHLGESYPNTLFIVSAGNEGLNFNSLQGDLLKIDQNFPLKLPPNILVVGGYKLKKDKENKKKKSQVHRHPESNYGSKYVKLFAPNNFLCTSSFPERASLNL